jgi:hypothetical protein
MTESKTYPQEEIIWPLHVLFPASTLPESENEFAIIKSERYNTKKYNESVPIKMMEIRFFSSLISRA